MNMQLKSIDVDAQKQKETEEAIKQVAMIGGIIVIAVGLFVFLITILWLSTLQLLYYLAMSVLHTRGRYVTGV